MFYGFCFFIGRTPLHCACLASNYESVKILLDNNADIYAIDINNNTPLVYAVKNGNYEIVRLLMSKMYQKNKLVDKWNIPFHMASQDFRPYLFKIYEEYLKLPFV